MTLAYVGAVFIDLLTEQNEVLGSFDLSVRHLVLCVCLSHDYGHTYLSIVVNFGNQYSVQMRSDVCLRVFIQDGGCFVVF